MGLFQREFGDLVAKQDPKEDGEFKVFCYLVVGMMRTLNSRDTTLLLRHLLING